MEDKESRSHALHKLLLKTNSVISLIFSFLGSKGESLLPRARLDSPDNLGACTRRHSTNVYLFYRVGWGGKKSQVSFLAAESCQIKICIRRALKMREGDLTYPRATFPPFSEFLPIAKAFGIYSIL